MQLNKTLNFFKTLKIDFYLAIILIFSIFLRFYNIGFQDAWLDEIHTLKESDPNISFKEFSDVIMFREGISHFYFIIVRGFFEIVGQSITYARWISAFFGILSVYYIYKIAKRLLDQNAGYLAAILLSLNLTHIEYSQEARVYSMYLFFVLLSTYHLLNFKEERTYKNAVILGVSSGLIGNAHSIGLLNIAVVFGTLLLLLLLTKTKADKIKFLKQCSLTGIVTIIVLSPVYLTIKKTTQIDSFWVAAPTFSNIKQVFIDLTGKSPIFFYFTLFLLIIFIVVSVYYIVNKNIKPNKVKFNLSFLLFWLLFCTSILIIKSYSGTSLILNRYFISILPTFILITSLSIVYFKNTILNYSFVLLYTVHSMYFIFINKDYYNTVTKTQFSSVTQEILNKKTNANVYSSWGWLMSYYINNEKGNQLITEMTFDDYVTAVKNNAVKTESFWYMDGNFRPLNLTIENQEFLKENFIVVYSIDKFDAWAKYYEPIKTLSDAQNQSQSLEINLYNNDFNPLFIDGNGNLMIFENSEVKSAIFNLKKGNYELVLSGNSMPLKKINNENAHLKIKINEKEIANLFLSENPSNKEIKVPFTQDKNDKVKVTLIFDNDLSVNGFDRNVKIYSIKIKNK